MRERERGARVSWGKFEVEGGIYDGQWAGVVSRGAVDSC